MATQNQKKISSVQTYKVLSPLRDGDNKYDEGDLIDMEESAAKELVVAGVLQAPKKAEPEAAAKEVAA